MARDDSADDRSRRHDHRQSRDLNSTSPPPRKRSRRDRDLPSPSDTRDKDYDSSRRHERSRDRPRRSEHSARRSRSPHSERRVDRQSSHADRSAREHGRRRDRSSDRHKRRSRSRSRSEQAKRSMKPLPSQNDAFNDTSIVKKSPEPKKEKPNFGTTGRLAAESNTVTAADGQTVVLKYHEPPEARKPASKDAWRMYVFKDADVVETVELGQRSCWLFGREHAVADFPIDHPSCSKQHAVIQFRYVEKKSEYGDKIGKVKPYLIDLQSANGTEVNGEVVPGGRYFELRDKDVVKFGLSSREYVLMLPPRS